MCFGFVCATTGPESGGVDRPWTRRLLQTSWPGFLRWSRRFSDGRHCCTQSPAAVMWRWGPRRGVAGLIHRDVNHCASSGAESSDRRFVQRLAQPTGVERLLETGSAASLTPNRSCSHTVISAVNITSRMMLG